MSFQQQIEDRIQKIQDIIGSDAGGRGMKSLIVPGDLLRAAQIFASLPPPVVDHHHHDDKAGAIIVVSGFPCCVNESPPTETDGPPGAMALCRTGVALGHRVVLVTDDCNRAVFEAAAFKLLQTNNNGSFAVETFPVQFTKRDEERFRSLVASCRLLIACERAGPARDGNCYTMRGIDMNHQNNNRPLVAPLHRLVNERREETVPFLAIGDGGNELGMGKVINAIYKTIPKGEQIGCVVAADCLVASSVSNWGGYALAAATALTKASHVIKAATATDEESNGNESAVIADYIQRCLPSEDEEISLLDRCVAAGCRDGVSGKQEATVDGMPLERSLQCLRDVRAAALGRSS